MSELINMFYLCFLFKWQVNIGADLAKFNRGVANREKNLNSVISL